MRTKPRIRFNPRRHYRLLLALGITTVFCGCRAVPVYEQKHLAKSGMQFSDGATRQYQGSTFSQLETGLSFSGGAQPTTCSACK